jgi:PBP1b-binding outer membrane lipoprotein LpoB
MRTLLPILVILLFLAGCSSSILATPDLPPSILDAANPMAENLMTSLQKDDYESFIQNMDATMLAGTTKPSFQDLRENLIGTYGDYQSLRFKNVAATGDFVSVFYALEFEKINLTMQLVLTPTQPYLISGLWFK